MSARSTPGNRRVVLVAPEFPPSNTAGAHRPRLFAKHLPSFGWTPTVLTIRADQIEGPLDPTLDRLVPPGLEVVRTGALPLEPVRLTGDLGLRTWFTHRRALAGMAAREAIDALVLFGPPWLSYALGPWARRRFGIPYVVDYIDPWISSWTASHPIGSKGWLFHRAAAAIEPRVLGRAAHVTAVSTGILDALRESYGWLASPMTAMPYGAEADDVKAAAACGIRPPDFERGDGTRTVAFTGALQPTGRPIVAAVLQAIDRVRRIGGPDARHMMLRAYGTSNLTWGRNRHSVQPIARDLGLQQLASEIPERIPYLQALAVLDAADVVLVAGSTDAYYHASKLYPAMVTGRPILAVCHEQSSIRQVVEQTATGIAVTFRRVDDLPGRVEEIAGALQRLTAAARRPPEAAAVERFTARASTRTLATILDQACGRGYRAAV